MEMEAAPRTSGHLPHALLHINPTFRSSGLELPKCDHWDWSYPLNLPAPRGSVHLLQTYSLLLPPKSCEKFGVFQRQVLGRPKNGAPRNGSPKRWSRPLKLPEPELAAGLKRLSTSCWICETHRSSPPGSKRTSQA